ncbi:iron ABC transporter permease [Corynebacterium sp. sy017]|uniref:FecCD family ABC transporter permease n=1 Tax=unclassified Corynebacterium TaxID=2624378 RepID=UPI0011870C2A|nr:iron ABC transporter permease [Corynebacterium sp. SY003]MBP3088509.1 iron ABC transporter permease [Corynebacterium sp. sy017]TSD91814.1 iron ABC transporter permease [Corynebacterium sp. SY003]
MHKRVFQRVPFALLCAIILCILLVFMLVGVLWGSVGLSVDQVVQALSHRLLGRSGIPEDPLAYTIVWQLRLPRVLAAALVGAGLAVSGAVLQAMVRNPLADPYTLGVSHSAALAAVLTMTSSSAVWLRNLGMPLAALLGAGVSLCLVLYLAQQHGKFTSARIVLAGVGVGQIALAGTTLVQLTAQPGEIHGILFWLLGSVAGVQKLSALTLPTLCMGLCIAYLFTQAKKINVLSMGDEDAHALGINIHVLRVQLIIVVAILTGMAVTLAGCVGFIGLIVPHCVRFIVGSDYRKVLPLSLLIGAIVLVLIDVVARLIDIPNEYPLTIFSAALGGPFFLWLLKRSNAGGNV